MEVMLHDWYCFVMLIVVLQELETNPIRVECCVIFEEMPIM